MNIAGLLFVFIALKTGPRTPLRLQFGDGNSLCTLNTSPPQHRRSSQERWPFLSMPFGRGIEGRLATGIAQRAHGGLAPGSKAPASVSCRGAAVGTIWNKQASQGQIWAFSVLNTDGRVFFFFSIALDAGPSKALEVQRASPRAKRVGRGG